MERARTLISQYWPAALAAVALVAPIFIDTISHAELFLAIALAGTGAALATAIWRGTTGLPKALTAGFAALAGYFLLRSLASTQPPGSLYGTYSVDASLLTLAAVLVGFAAAYAWRASSPATRGLDSPAVITLLWAVTGYASASGIAAWEWGSTDGVNGPASGLTPNSQYQLQLLSVGLCAAIAIAIIRRRDLISLLVALLASIVLVANLFECRSSALYLAALGALFYAGALAWARTRVRPSVFAGIVTALIGCAGVALAALVLLVPSASGFIDRLGTGRGSLWTSAAHVFAANPLFGRGPGHVSLITGWHYDAGSFSLTSTVDVHNLLLTLLATGGVIGFALALAALFLFLHRIAESLFATPRSELVPALVLAAGSAALFVYAQLAFVYPVAWVLGALVAGLIAAADVSPRVAHKPATARSPKDPGATTATPAAPARPAWLRATTAALLALSIVALVAGLPQVLTNRSRSIHLFAGEGPTDPWEMLDAQLDLVTHPWDVTAAETALTLYSQAVGADATRAATFAEDVARASRLTAPNRTWDARLAASELQVWAARAQTGQADTAALDALIADAHHADPACALWPAAGSALLAQYGDAQGARKWARVVTGDAGLLAQARRDTDGRTFAAIEESAAR